MPFVSVRLCQGAFTKPQLQTLIADITDAVVKMGGDGIREFTTVVIDEVADGLWGEGGKILDLAAIEANRKARV